MDGAWHRCIGLETAEQMKQHGLVLWPFHRFGSGPTLDDAFGLIDTAEKSAEILVKFSRWAVKTNYSWRI